LVDEVDIINVKMIINEWDPIDLLAYAPSDEYHSEINAIEQLLKISADSESLAVGIYDIFHKAFGEDVFKKTHSECAIISKKIHASNAILQRNKQQ